MSEDAREELEDTRDDVLRKAFAMAGITPCALPENGEDRNNFLRQTLHLDPTSFLSMNDSIPSQELPAGLTRHILPFHDWTLNIWTIETDKGIIAIDTGISPEQLRSAACSTSALPPAAILITHLHHDHVGGITAFPDAPLYSPESIRPGMHLEIAGLRWDILDLAGHTPAGIGWLTEYKGRTLFFPGDSIFARSIGKCAGHERLAMTNIIHAMNALPPETLICPGHGPATTVEDEWRLNPFITPYTSFRI